MQSLLAELALACGCIAVALSVPAFAQDDDDLPGTFGEATKMFADEEREERKEEGEYTSFDMGETTTDIPAAKKKELQAQVRTIFERMGNSFVSGDVDGVLALYSDSYGYFGKKKDDIRRSVAEYLQDYDALEMSIKTFRASIRRTVSEPYVYYADASVIWNRREVRTGTSREDRLSKGTPDAVERMKEDPDFEEAAEALEEFYESQKQPLDTSSKDATPLGKEVKRNIKANFRLEKKADSWKIIEAEFGTLRKTKFMGPEETWKKMWIFVPTGSVILFLVGLVLFKLSDVSLPGEQVAVEEDQAKFSPEYKKQIEEEVFGFIESLSEGKRDEEVEELLRLQRWDEARYIIRDRVSIAHELHDRKMGALYGKYEKKILEWETRYANFY